MCFFMIFSKNTFQWKLLSDCCNKFDYPGSIVYLSCWDWSSILFCRVTFNQVSTSFAELKFGIWFSKNTLIFTKGKILLVFDYTGPASNTFSKCNVGFRSMLGLQLWYISLCWHKYWFYGFSHSKQWDFTSSNKFLSLKFPMLLANVFSVLAFSGDLTKSTLQ